MIFKVRDLMITVLPESVADCDAGASGCPNNTTCTRTREDCVDSEDILQLTPYPVVGDPLLSDLRLQLQHALALTKERVPALQTPGVESLERVEEKLRPQTREQIRELENKLTAALEELRRMNP
ncbi:MAG TPA: hypothetical protein VIT23_04715 [Terrimicrobiaceae bacterium]